jgi:hypothetical protein
MTGIALEIKASEVDVFALVAAKAFLFKLRSIDRFAMASRTTGFGVSSGKGELRRLLMIE